MHPPFKDKVALTSGQWGNIATAYTYDAQGNLIDETRQYPGKSVEIKSSYDDTGLMLSQWNSLSNRTQTNAYDSLGRLTKVGYTLNGQPQTVIDNFQYTPTNLLTGYRYPLHNIATELAYHPKTDRITQWKVTGPGAFYVADDNSLATPNTPVMTYISETYDYDPAGNMTKKSSTDGRGILTATDFTYDSINQLTQTLRLTGTQTSRESYRYDTQGNLLQRDPGASPQKYQIANDSNQITAMWTTPKKGDAGWWDFTYDPNGNLTTKKALTAKKPISNETLFWDAQNHLIRHEFTPKNLPMMVQAHRYDLTGLRYKSDTAFNAGILGVWSPLKRTDWTLYDPAQRLIAEEISDTGQNKPTGINDPNFKELQTIGYVNIGLHYAIKVTQRQSPALPIGPDEITYEHRDPLGTNSQSTTIVPYVDFGLPAGTPHNSSLTLTPYGTIDHYRYLPHGQYPDLPEFTGKRLEPASMMYYFHARYFDPQVGRFIGHDLVEPDLAHPLTLNPFLFCLNNPVRWVDLDGRLFTAAEKQAQLVNVQITKYGVYHQSSNGIVSDYQNGNVKHLVCNQYIALTYKLAGESSIPYDGNVNNLKNWFASGDPAKRVYLSGSNVSMQNLEKGDALFMSWGGSKIPTHVEMIKDVFKVDGIVKGFKLEGAKSTVSGVGERSRPFISLEDYSIYMGNITIFGIGQMQDKP